MPARRTPKTFRLPAETIAKMGAIREARDGLDLTRIVENAIELYYRAVCVPEPTAAPRSRRASARSPGS